jgi:hypothetical protein
MIKQQCENNEIIQIKTGIFKTVECKNKADYKVTLTEDFDNEVYFWCADCVSISTNAKMIEKKCKLNNIKGGKRNGA